MAPKMTFSLLLGAAIAVAGCATSSAPESTGPGAAAGGPVQTAVAASLAGSSGGGGGTSVTGPCSLLTQAEVSAVVGQAVGPGSNASDSHACDWQYPADGVPTVQASIGFDDGSLASYCEVPSDSGLGISIVQVSGVGDGACFIEMAGLASGSNLTFAKGGQVYATSAILGPNATSAAIQAAATSLALDALARL
jgi:hypothetical protein